MNLRLKNAVDSTSIYLGSAISVSGVQAVGPGLPILQQHFGVSNSHMLWAMSFYLFPGIVAAVPLGKVGDRIGRMKLFATCLVVYGFASSVIPLTGISWPLFLATRVIQGSAFAGILPLSIVLVAEHGRGGSILKRQGLRSVVQQTADTVHPLIGGLLVTAAWYAPYLVGAAALPIGMILFFVRFDDDYKRSQSDSAAKKVQLRGNLPLIALIFGGFLRFFIKFIPLSSLGILLIVEYEFSTIFAGFALALSSFIGIFGALSIGTVSKYIAPFHISVISLSCLAVSLVATSLTDNPFLVILSVSVFGFSDGLFGTVQNSYVSVAVPNELRGTFSGMVAMSRNIGKFVAPITMGAVFARTSLSTAFVVGGVFTALSIALLPPLRFFDTRLAKKK
jgi:MFS transporter, ACDE family, multidrug resistance protein